MAESGDRQLKDQDAASPAPIGAADDLEPVPRLPRGKGLRLSSGEIIRIAMFAALLVGVVALQRPCSEGVAGFVESFSPPDAGVKEAPMPQGELIPLRGDETEDELREKIERIQRGQGEPAGQGEGGRADGVDGVAE